MRSGKEQNISNVLSRIPMWIIYKERELLL